MTPEVIFFIDNSNTTAQRGKPDAVLSIACSDGKNGTSDSLLHGAIV